MYICVSDLFASTLFRALTSIGPNFKTIILLNFVPCICLNYENMGKCKYMVDNRSDEIVFCDFSLII